MVSQLYSVAAIFVSAVFFLMGNGLIVTLTPLRADLDGFSALAGTGPVAAWPEGRGPASLFFFGGGHRV